MEAVPDEALIVVDGVVSSRAELEALDPQRIDRVEVLKGPAARDEYGDRGANGVVRIFLKN
jgi:outer membrane receptor for ferrienterochelin and colicin